MESTCVVSDELNSILKEEEIGNFLLLFQNYLTESDGKRIANNKYYSVNYYRNISSLDEEINRLNSCEKRLLKVKINSLIAYQDDMNKIILPSPLIIGVYTAVISLVLGVMIKNSIIFPEWAVVLVLICFVLIIPGISWFTLQQSGESAEHKEVLTIIKELVSA